METPHISGYPFEKPGGPVEAFPIGRRLTVFVRPEISRCSPERLPAFASQPLGLFDGRPQQLTAERRLLETPALHYQLHSGSCGSLRRTTRCLL